MVCRTAEGPVHRLWEPLADKQKPISSYGAKFSLPYSLAVMLVQGRAGLEEFTDAAIQDAESYAWRRKFVMSSIRPSTIHAIFPAMSKFI